MKDKMAKLNANLIQQRAREIKGCESARDFERLMGWNSPSKASRIYYGTAKSLDFNTIEQVAFTLGLNPGELIQPSGKKPWPSAKK
jgi:hypothetical protein